MRNLAYAEAFAMRAGLRSAGMLFVQSEGAKSSRRVTAEFRDFRSRLAPGVQDRVGMTSYEAITRLLADSGYDRELATWLENRLRSVHGLM